MGLKRANSPTDTPTSTPPLFAGIPEELKQLTYIVIGLRVGLILAKPKHQLATLILVDDFGVIDLHLIDLLDNAAVVRFQLGYRNL